MAHNVLAASQLLSLYRTRSQALIYASFKPKAVEEKQMEGWTVVRRNKTTVRMSRPKEHGVALEDRVWTLFYRMGFPLLSGPKGLMLRSGTVSNQLDIVAIDEDVAVAVECKSLATPGRRSSFQGELGKFSLIREPFGQLVKDIPSDADHSRQLGYAMFLSNAILSDIERERAKNHNIALFDSKDLEYYEQLTSYIGTAARYQFLADLLPGRKVPGLSVNIPAIKSRMGGYTCYTFSISPEILLKLAYVSHRTKGRASDVDAYQRMISKSRLRSIQSYIDSDTNIFPTNIVLALDSAQQFEQTRQDYSSSETLGWLRLKGTYKSAWVIDGQHRLFAYANSPRASKSRLTVLAFENLDADVQAELFININGEQRSVKKSLLQELYSELHWNATDDSSRIKAVVAKAVKTLDEDLGSPFYKRIRSAEGSASPQKSVYFGNFFSALSQRELFRRKARKGKEEVPGPL